MTELAPVALFVYNRPQHSRQTVEALKLNSLAPRTDLFIFSDAPKDRNAARAVREVREYLTTITGFRSIQIMEQKTNLGLAESVIQGVTHLCSERGKVIVLEDDIVTSPHFLEFMNNALIRYEMDDRVMQISGYMYPVQLSAHADALFLPLTVSWGWATWQRAWQQFDKDASGYKTLKNDIAARKDFNLGGAYNYYRMLENQLHGRIDSWAIRWYLSVWLKGGLVLYPVKSLVKNIGFDGSGTHGAASCYLSDALEEFRVQSYPEAATEAEVLQAVRRYLSARLQRGLAGRGLKLLRDSWEACLGWLQAYTRKP